MRGRYDSTQNPGDQRTRSHKQTIVTPNGGIPSIGICEQRIILAESDDGTITEQVLKELPSFSVDISQEILATEFDELDLDDVPTGRKLTGYAAMIAYRSFIRHCQFQRDTAIKPPPTETDTNAARRLPDANELPTDQ